MLINKYKWLLVILAVLTVVVIFYRIGVTIYNNGYAAAEAIYQKQANEAVLTKVENTEKLEAEKEKLKQREKNLNDDCKALYYTDLRACRQQLRRKN